MFAWCSQGDEELAREALSRRQQQVDVADSLGEQMAIQGEAINKLFNSMQQLEAKITEARVRHSTYRFGSTRKDTCL